MAPRKAASSLLSQSRDAVKKGLVLYINHHACGLNFTGNDFQEKIERFRSRTETGREEVDELFQGSLRCMIEEGLKKTFLDIPPPLPLLWQTSSVNIGALAVFEIHGILRISKTKD